MKYRCFLRLLAMLLCLLVLFSAVSCAGGEDGEKAPDGMQFATAVGADYRFFVPTHWSRNTAYGISGGYYSLGTQSTVSLEKYPITAEMEATLSSLGEQSTAFEETERETGEAEKLTPAGIRVNWFYETELKPHLVSLATGEVEMIEINCEPVLLDGVNARQYHARATVAGNLLHFVHAVGERGGAFYVLTFISADSLYENLKADYSSMLAAFRFSDTPYTPDEPAKEIGAEEAPEGMKLASNGDVAYAFYVPTAWTVDIHEEIFAATAPDGSSVSVIPYVPGGDEVMNVPEYFAYNKEAMLGVSPGGLEMISEQEIQLDGSAAMRYEYLYTVSGVTYRYVQIITVWRGMFHNVTYTALPENFEANLADLQRILDAFDLR